MKTAVVITSINSPTEAVRDFAALADHNDWSMYVIGDKKGPEPFDLDGCSFVSLEDQLKLPFAFPNACPTGHYARKNIGYLMAIAGGAARIYETDDDNIPYAEEFVLGDAFDRDIMVVDAPGPVNVYKWFSDTGVWPRGLPLESLPSANGFEVREPANSSLRIPVFQGLADDNPDVDAVYRLTRELPVKFNKRAPLVLAQNSWSPFNSQNTTWLKEAFPLLYLPAFCSFRMTDIWRSFVCQRILWESDMSVLFHNSTVYQERNEHNLLRDFEEEIPGYLHNSRIINELSALSLKGGVEHMPDDILSCYERLIELDLVGKEELSLLRLWLADIERL